MSYKTFKASQAMMNKQVQPSGSGWDEVRVTDREQKQPNSEVLVLIQC